jgi:hypothetical protein
MAQDQTEDTTGYSYRNNQDGTVDSICRCCFRTVGTAHNEEALFASELTHRCSEDNIRHFEREKNSLINWPDPYQERRFRR